ncbi:MAG: hypothetical protein WCD18_05620 [Thermosynechococcaceae cyanobacterium]
MSQETACVRLRGKNTQSPALIKPYGQVLMEGNPIFEWNAVSGSNQYDVNILSQDKHWKSTTSSLKLAFSKEQNLEPGKTYQIIIQSYKGKELQGVSVSAFSILNKSDQLQLTNYISDIRKGTIESQAKSIVALYNHYELTDEAIRYLERLKKINKTNPSIYRLLGDSYLDAGFPDLAEVNYQIAYRIAWGSDSSSEAMLANTGLQNIENIIGNPQ